MEPDNGVIVVVVPLPVQGHLNQFVHLSLLLSSHGLTVHYASTSTHIRQAKSRLQGWDSNSLQAIHFHHLPLPPFPTPPPDPNSAVKFPAQLQPLLDAFEYLRSPLASLLRSLSASSRRLVVIHDSLACFAAEEAAALPNAESFSFEPVSVVSNDGELAEPMLRARGVALPTFDRCFTEEFSAFIKRNADRHAPFSAMVFNTCRPIEGEFIDLLARKPDIVDKKLFFVGPLNPVVLKRGDEPRHECLEWLDDQPPASVLYVAFGSTTAMSDGQIEQLATALQNCGQRFIWVRRDADRGDIFATTSEDRSRQSKFLLEFEKNVEGLGILCRDWAPQLEILAHPSTGGFMSHCGWNSCMESLSMGVPIVAWPMHCDQPRNAMLVTEYLKVGVKLRDWAGQEEILPAEVIEEQIEMLMASDEGKEIRQRARSLGEAVREAISEGGSSRVDYDSLIAHITG